jgi:rhodanese-related sulfurtransferase
MEFAPEFATELATAQQPEREIGSADTTALADIRTPEELAAIVSQFAASGAWLSRVRLRADRRWYERRHHGADHDIWVISWLPGQSTGFHDHGASSGAFVVVTGTLEEDRPGEGAHAVHPGNARAFGPDYAHDVRNVSLAPAISIHAYSPPLDEMNHYEFDGDQLVPRASSAPSSESLDQDWRQSTQDEGASASTVATEPGHPVPSRTNQSIDQVLATARARLHRLSPGHASEAIGKGAVLVDIRPESQRAAEGSIPVALVVERNVLEWRFDPTSNARLPVARDHNLQLIVFCSEGYTSSLAAASLHDLGLWRATDIAGGFQAWQAAGLPVLPPDLPRDQPHS